MSLVTFHCHLFNWTTEVGWLVARAQALTQKALGTTLVAIAVWRQHLQMAFDIATYHSRQEVTESLPPLLWILNELIKK